jgi:hypothetical protein
MTSILNATKLTTIIMKTTQPAATVELMLYNVLLLQPAARDATFIRTGRGRSLTPSYTTDRQTVRYSFTTRLTGSRMPNTVLLAEASVTVIYAAEWTRGRQACLVASSTGAYDRRCAPSTSLAPLPPSDRLTCCPAWADAREMQQGPGASGGARPSCARPTRLRRLPAARGPASPASCFPLPA